jgi:hypothetical protein
MRERALKWLKSIEEYLASGDGDRDLEDDDREILAYLVNLLGDEWEDFDEFVQREVGTFIEGR